jgi:hypothetical protein
MLMVCMTGTAVEISNAEEILPGLGLVAEDARELRNEMSRLEEAMAILAPRN